MQRYPDLLGLKGRRRVFKSAVKVWGSTLKFAVETGDLSTVEAERNSWCSGEMLRYHEEPDCEGPAKPPLTLRLESAGIKQD